MERTKGISLNTDMICFQSSQDISISWASSQLGMVGMEKDSLLLQESSSSLAMKVMFVALMKLTSICKLVKPGKWTES